MVQLTKKSENDTFKSMIERLEQGRNALLQDNMKLYNLSTHRIFIIGITQTTVYKNH